MAVESGIATPAEERHDLVRFIPEPHARYGSRWQAVCACGWTSGLVQTQARAVKVHHTHQAREEGKGK